MSICRSLNCLNCACGGPSVIVSSSAQLLKGNQLRGGRGEGRERVDSWRESWGSTVGRESWR